MIEGLIEARVRELQPANAVEQENAVQEVMQAFVLASLARCGFFSSDRAVQQYCEEIWKVEPLPVKA